MMIDQWATTIVRGLIDIELLLRKHIFIELFIIACILILLGIIYFRTRFFVSNAMNRYQLLLYITHEFRKPFHQSKIFTSILEHIRTTIPTIKGVMLVIYSTTSDKERLRVSSGLNHKTVEAFRITKQLRKNLESHKCILIDDPTLVDLEGKEMRRSLVIPLVVHSHVVGFFLAAYRRQHLRQLDEMFCKVVAEQISVELAGRLLQRKLDEYTRGLSLVEYSYESIVDNLPSGVIALDTDLQILLHNRSMERIFPIKQHLDKKYPDMWRNTGVYQLMKRFVGRLEEEKKLVTAHKISYSAGKYNKVINVMGYPLFDMHNEIIAYIIIHQDITEQHTLEQELYTTQQRAQRELEQKVRLATGELVASNKELMRLNKLKSEFVSIISHELKTPMTSIKGYVTLLLSGRMGEITDQQRHSLRIVAEESDRLANLINDVLDLSRLESGKTTLHTSSSTLHEVISQGISVIAPQAKDKQITLEYKETKAASASIEIDTAKIKQVIINLLSNAVKFTNEGGKVTVKVFDRCTHLECKVIDTGIGISSENIKHLFEPFFQGEEHLTRNAAGTGLGLTISKHIMELHGGTIKVESVVDKGTSVIITLPKTLSAQSVG